MMVAAMDDSVQWTNPNFDAMTSYIKAGFALVPIPAGSKGPNTKGWNDRANVITTVEAANTIQGNVGLAHAYCTPRPTAALDIDNYEIAAIWLAQLGVDLDQLVAAEDSVLIVSGRVNRTKLLFTLPDDVGSLATVQHQDADTKEMVFEFRCASKNGTTVQDVLPPSIHPDTGKQYEWGGRGHLSKLPCIPAPLLEIWMDKLSSGGSGRQQFSVKSPVLDHGSTSTPASEILTQEQIRDLRSALLFLRADDRTLWVDCGMALRPFGEVGRGLWLDWSATSEKFDSADASRVWDSLQPTKISYKSIFSKAQEAGWANPAKKLAASAEADYTWSIPEELPPALKDVPEFDPEFLPEAFKTGAVDIADRLQCTVEFVAVPLLVGLGALIGNKVGIYPKAHDETWTVYAALWGAIVGPPGSMKSPAQHEAFKPLHHLEEQAAIQHRKEMVPFDQAQAQYDQAMKDFKVGKIKIFPVKPDIPKRRRYLVNDTTYQALGVVLSENPSGVLAFSDELSGLLQSLDTAGQEAARGFYLSGWGGSGHCSIDRISRGSILLTNYCISLFGGFQPDRLKSYVRQTQNGSANNDGLIQRFQMIVWPDQKKEIRVVDRPPNGPALTRIFTSFMGLNDLKAGARLHFEPEAQELFNQWYGVNEKLLRRSTLDPARNSHFAKYRSLIPGLALLNHLADGHSGSVCLPCLDKSIRFSSYLKAHAHRIYSSVQGLDHAPMLALAARLRSGWIQSGFTKRDLTQKGWRDLTSDNHPQEALDGLVVRGWLRESEQKSGGRPTIKYLINPRIGLGF